MLFIVSVKTKTIKENKEIKVRKSQPNSWPFVKKLRLSKKKMAN